MGHLTTVDMHGAVDHEARRVDAEAGRVVDDLAVERHLHERRRLDLGEEEAVGVDEEVPVLPRHACGNVRVDEVGQSEVRGEPVAWALRPEVMFLDEPTASLDPKATRAVEDIVRDIHARGTTVVMSTHNLAQAKRLATDVLFLSEGRQVEHTPATRFFTSPRTSEAAAFLEGERL